MRGIVTTASSTSVTLQLHDRTLTRAIDPLSTATRAPAQGERVEVHYSDRKGERRVVLVVQADTSGTLSKRPGRSYRGVFEEAKRGTLRLRVERRRRSLRLESKTVLLDAGGRAVATGRKDIVAHLTAGEPLLVIYDEVSEDMFVGDVYMSSSSKRARTIRQQR